MPIDLFESVAECGCAAKVPAGALARLLAGLPAPADPAVLVGTGTLDDAGIYRLPDGTCLVQTVDFFPPVARDPFVYGRIAAANALSDVYAMGGRPVTALGIVCCPSALVAAGALGEIVRGAGEALAEAGCSLLGGHSVVDPQLKFGLAVTGLVGDGDFFDNASARPGDVLLLTKPVGTGVTTMAVRASLASKEQEMEANRVMGSLNRQAAELAREHGARCVTDITGFGLLGHAVQLARASRVGLEIEVSSLPLLDGVREFAAMGLLSAAAYNNRAYVGESVRFGSAIDLSGQDLLFDPQTSGGLLICCPPDRAAGLLARAQTGLGTDCAIIGRVVEPSAGAAIEVSA